MLEHLETVITPWVDIIEKRLGPGDCSLSMADSSTSEGCLKKSNFIEEGDEAIQATIRLEVSRGDAKIMMKNKIKNYAQWFYGSMNNVSDALSRENDRIDEEIINIFHIFTPS